MRNVKDEEWKEVGESDGPKRAYTQTGLTKGEKYSFRVRSEPAFLDEGKGAGGPLQKEKDRIIPREKNTASETGKQNNEAEFLDGGGKRSVCPFSTTIGKR